MKIALDLLSHELSNPATQSSLNYVALRFCDAAMSLGKNAQRSIKGSITTLLIKPLTLVKDGISRGAYIEPQTASSLDNYLRPGLEATISKKGAKPADTKAANELIDWLGKQKVTVKIAQPETPAPVKPESKTSAHNQPEVKEDGMPNVQDNEPLNSPRSSEAVLSAETSDVKQATEVVSGKSEPAEPSKPAESESLNKGDSEAESPTKSEYEAAVERTTKGEVSTKTGGTAKTKSSAKGANKSNKQPAKGKKGDEDDQIDMATIIKFLSKFQKEHAKLEKQLKSVRSENTELSKNAINQNLQLRAAQREIEDLTERRTTLSGNYAALQQRHEALRAENQSLRSELDDANEMIAMMDEGASHEADAVLESLGRELNYDYRKYLAAAEQPMTEELGNIVLGQLRTVFGILERHGIDLQ